MNYSEVPEYIFKIIHPKKHAGEANGCTSILITLRTGTPKWDSRRLLRQFDALMVSFRTAKGREV